MIKKKYRNGCWFQYDPERPNVRFLGGGSPSKTKLPPVSDPTPTPEDVGIQAAEAGEAARKRLRSKFGRASTILTELGTTTQAKSPILGTVGA